MRYISTRNKNISVSSSEAILQGISKDGGLFIPERIPELDIEKLKFLDYKSLAYEILSKFLTDYKEESLKECISKAYDNKFSTEKIAPLVEVGEVYFLELFHGPTLAFKDMALSILPYLLKEAMKINKMQEEIVILTATSGDTGKAALQGFSNVEGIKIIVFYPENGVSPIQKLQMNTEEGRNTFVVGIKGNFDDAQKGVKNIFNDEGFNRLLEENNYKFSSANSINIGRLLPQIVYYFNSYLELLRNEKINIGDKINIVVPTGNFGNILAAYYGKKMGLPVNKLICASNENNVLRDFLKTGIYNRKRKLSLTTSPSMDILVSSNLERLLFYLGYEDKEVEKLMKELINKGQYKIDKSRLSEFYGEFSTDGEVKNTIKRLYENEGYLMDTHTAIGFNVYEKYRDETKDSSKTIIASTASPLKFGRAVAESIELGLKNEDEFKIIEDLLKIVGRKDSKSILDLKEKKIIHKNTCGVEEMESVIKTYLKVGDYSV